MLVPSLSVTGLVFYVMQRPIFTAGYDAMCHCHTCEEECTVVEILSVMDRRTQVKRKQRFAKEGAMVTAKFKVGTSLRLSLGRLFLVFVLWTVRLFVRFRFDENMF